MFGVEPRRVLRPSYRAKGRRNKRHRLVLLLALAKRLDGTLERWKLTDVVPPPEPWA